MPNVCFLCKGNTLGSIRFPCDYAKKSRWLNNLHLSNVPKDARLCVNHFKENDFIEGKRKTTLRETAVPTLPATPPPTHLTLSSVLREHCYSTASTERESLIKNLIQLIFSVGVLFITLLSILFFICEKEDYEHFFEETENRDKYLYKKNKKPRGKFTPAIPGFIQIMYF